MEGAVLVGSLRGLTAQPQVKKGRGLADRYEDT